MKNYTLITLLLSVFIAMLGIGVIVPIMPVFARELGANGVALGMIIAAFSVVRGLFQPLVGSLSDKWGRKGFLMVGLVIYAIVGLMIPQATSVAHLIAIRGFHGVGSAMIVPIGMAYMSFLAPSGSEGRYMSYLNIAIFSGIGCGPVLGGLFSDQWGMESVFYMMALLSFLAFILVIRYMPPHVPSENEVQRRLLPSLLSMLRNGKTCGILLARYATMIIMVPTMAFLPLLMAEWQGTTGVQIGLVIASRTLLNAIFQIPFGKFVDGHNKLAVLLISSLTLASTVALIPEVKTFGLMIILYAVLGTAEAAIWSVLGAYASVEAKQHYGHGTMMGVFAFAMSAGVFTGAMLAGFSMDGWGIGRAYHVTGGVVLALSLIAAMLIGNYEKKRAVA